MRMYVADSGDTLRHIAERLGIDLPGLLSLNPHISNADRPVSGIPIHLPSTVRRPETYAPISKGHWIPVTSPEKMTQYEYDVIIVGTGAGGGAALWRLCEQWGDNGKKIGVVEAGDLLIPDNSHNLPTLEGERLREYYLDVSIPVADSGFREVIALGGRTLIWNAVTPRMYLYTTGSWPVPEPEMDRYYNIAEQVMNVTDEFTDGSPINKIFLNRLWGSRYTHAINEPLAIDLGKSSYGIVRSNVYFSSIALLARALNRKSFDLAINTRAVKVLTESNKVTGVRVMSLDKQSYDLKAKTVIISASTIETPRLLLHSGIPGEAIGRYLTDHTFTHAVTKFKRQDEPAAWGTAAILIPQVYGQPYQVQIEYPSSHLTYHDLPSLIRESPEMIIVGVGTVQPRFENRITLDPGKTDEFGVPEVQLHMSYTETDYSVIGQAEKTVSEIASVLDVSVISSDRTTKPAVGAHAAGTCRMGHDPSTSAVNRYGQIHGISGLYVADNSMIPVLGAANPTLATVALSIRTADYIAGVLK